MMKFYYAPGSCAMSVHILLEDAEAKYEANRIDLDTVSNRLEDNSDNLISKYKEYDFLMKKISEIEFESDNKAASVSVSEICCEKKKCSD